MAQEFASHGFIVFVIDHLDGSCCYTELENGDVIEFDGSHPRLQHLYEEEVDPAVARENMKYWKKKIYTRIDELNELIALIGSPPFAREILNF